ncbi:MAG TPA: S1C family serine protease [Acidimicrobiales bacterium]|nr:S1C family serine protease [Acidimicrobiales bacterium]
MQEEHDGLSRRERFLPSTVKGMTALILAFSVGAAFSGTVLYAFYEFRLNRTEDKVSRFVKGFDQRFKTATKTIDAERENAKAEIDKAIEPLRQIRAEGETLEALVKKTQPSVWFVRTLDEAGQPSVGSGFVVASDPDQSLLLTSYTTVRAATQQPGPAVFVRKGDSEVKATVWTWQEDKDIALLIVDRGNIPKLSFAPKDPPSKVGERVFAVSGLGAGGGAIAQGFVADVSSAGIQHDAGVGPAFQGGPLVNSRGQVLAVSSRAYAPLGFQSEAVFFAPPVRAACGKVLNCPSGSVAGAGARRR